MADVEVNIIDNSGDITAAFDNGMPVALEKCALVAENYAARLCPVDTGRLRGSISHAVTNNEAYIGTNVEYGPYVELGTTRTRAQPFLRPAVADHIDQYKQIIRDTLSNMD
jgi:HK97 gp10 family phage protein